MICISDFNTTKILSLLDLSNPLKQWFSTFSTFRPVDAYFQNFGSADFYLLAIGWHKRLGQNTITPHMIYSWLSRSLTAMGSCTGLVTVGPTKV